MPYNSRRMQASPAQRRSYLWHPSGKRLAVDLRLEAVDRLAAETLSGFDVPGRGIEVGGLLLGRTRREGGVTIVEVEDIEPIECEHAAGQSLMLSAPDRHALEARLRRRKSSVVGFYRSNTRREFAVTLEDVALLSSYFADPSSVFLLIHAVRDESLRAGFVTWEGRAVSGKTPWLEFPLDSEALARHSRVIEPPAPVPVTERQGTSRLGPGAGWVAAGLVVVGVTAGVLYDTSARKAAPPAPPSTRAASAPAPAVAPAAPELLPPKRELPPAVETTGPITIARPPTPGEAVPAPTPQVPIATAHRTAPEPLRAFTPVTPAFPAPDPPVVADPPALSAPPPSDTPQSLLAGMVTPPPQSVERPPVVRPAPGALVDVAVDSVPAGAAKFRPPAPVRQPRPQVPADVQRGIKRAAIVNVRVYVDRAGKVEFAELLSDGTGANRELAAIAVFAARRWEFEPATVNGKAVPGKAVLRFRFAPDPR
jgi:TonB family protein